MDITIGPVDRPAQLARINKLGKLLQPNSSANLSLRSTAHIHNVAAVRHH